MTLPWAWLALGGLIVLAVGIWLRRRQEAFIAELRAAGDPLAGHRGTKTFRREFQAWLIRGGAGAQARGLVTLVLGLVLMALAVYSLAPDLWE